MNRISKRQQARQGERCRARREVPKRAGCVGTLLDLFVNGTRINPFPRLRMDKRKQRRRMRKRFMGGTITISVSALEAEKFCHRYIKPLPYRDELDNFPDAKGLGVTHTPIRLAVDEVGVWPPVEWMEDVEERYSALKESILGRHMGGEGLWRHPDEQYEAFRKRVLDKIKAEYDV